MLATDHWMCLRLHLRPHLLWRKVSLGMRITLPAESTLASIYMRKELIHIAQAKSWQQCSCIQYYSNSLILARLAKKFTWRKVGPVLGWWPTTEKAKPLFVSHVNSLSSIVRNASNWKVGFPIVAWVGKWQNFSI